ncbi:MAG TPA: S41 family peptidase [Puia sp.]|nr:S41 family peptidase [Puia sp.]
MRSLLLFLFVLSGSSLLHAQPCQAKADGVLDEALGFMKKNYYRKESVQWDKITSEARTRLKASNNCDDVYDIISWCFKQLDEQHSFIMPPKKAGQYNYDPSLAPLPPLSELVGEIHGEWLNDSIAYLTVPWVSTTDSMICMRIADSLQEMIARLDGKGVSRWIIDLRKNTGGNCWPMLAGIGPLLGDGVCGYFVNGDERIPITYRNGAACQGKHVLCRVSKEGYRMQQEPRSIVVLTGRRTVSAGEIVALAFSGREKAHLLGEPTAGYTTANATYSLSDHSMLVLTVCREADHTGKICEGSILPDKIIRSVAMGPAEDDPVKSAAIDWLQAR